MIPTAAPAPGVSVNAIPPLVRVMVLLGRSARGTATDSGRLVGTIVGNDVVGGDL